MSSASRISELEPVVTPLLTDQIPCTQVADDDVDSKKLSTAQIISFVDLQQAYDSGSDGIILLDSGNGALIIKDAATPIATNLFRIESNDGITYYLNITDDDISTQKDLAFRGSAARIRGNFFSSPATGTYFMSDNPDQTTSVGAIPNGTGTYSEFKPHNSSNSTNYSYGTFGSNATEVYLDSDNAGSGTLLPIELKMNGATKFTVATSGDISVDAGDLTITSGEISIMGADQGIAFRGSAGRIRGNFFGSQAVRTLLMSDNPDQLTDVGAIPNGSATDASYSIFNTSNTTNYSYGKFGISTSAIYFDSDSSGTGTLLPIEFKMNGTLSYYLDVSGNFNFSSGKLCKIDTTNATVSNRFAFMSNSDNSATYLNVRPNGTNLQSAFIAYGATDADNAPYIYVGIDDTAQYIKIDSRANGTGTFRPIGLYMNGTLGFSLTTAGLFQEYSGNNRGIDVFNVISQSDVVLNGSGSRIQGNFYSGISTGTCFISSTANQVTSVGAIPNGSGAYSEFKTYNTTNSSTNSYTRFGSNQTVAYLDSGVTGAGSQLPLRFQIAGSDKFGISTAGLFEEIGSNNKGIDVYNVSSTWRQADVTSTAVSANAVSHYTLVTSNAAQRTITILSADIALSGKEFVIKDAAGTAGSANSIIVATEGSETIDGAATATITANYGWVKLVSNGSNLFVVG